MTVGNQGTCLLKIAPLYLIVATGLCLVNPGQQGDGGEPRAWGSGVWFQAKERASVRQRQSDLGCAQNGRGLNPPEYAGLLYSRKFSLSSA